MEQRVLLALSSFRYSDREVGAALDLCRELEAELLVLFVVDVNLARYFAGTGVMAGTSLREQMEKGLLDDQKRQAEETLEKVRQAAEARGIACRALLKVGRFAVETRAVVAAESTIATPAPTPAAIASRSTGKCVQPSTSVSAASALAARSGPR